MSDLISRQDVINTALDFFVDFLDGAVHEDDQKIFIKRINELPSAERTDISEILQYLDDELHPIVSPEHWNVYAELHDMISALSAERKGKWISLDDYRGKYNDNGYKCSECGEHSDYEENFCPDCGARMVSEE